MFGWRTSGTFFPLDMATLVGTDGGGAGAAEGSSAGGGHKGGREVGTVARGEILAVVGLCVSTIYFLGSCISDANMHHRSQNLGHAEKLYITI